MQKQLESFNAREHKASVLALKIGDFWGHMWTFNVFVLFIFFNTARYYARMYLHSLVIPVTARAYAD